MFSISQGPKGQETLESVRVSESNPPKLARFHRFHYVSGKYSMISHLYFVRSTHTFRTASSICGMCGSGMYGEWFV